MILDLSMPDIDGLEVLRRMRADARMAAVPVVIHTSRLLDDARGRADRVARRSRAGQVGDVALRSCSRCWPPRPGDGAWR